MQNDITIEKPGLLLQSTTFFGIAWVKNTSVNL